MCFQSQMQKRIMNLESKIDKILNSVDSLRTAVQNINVKLDCFEKRLNELEGGINTKHAELTGEAAKKAPAEEVQILTDRIQKLEL